jgi:hypothetical protein
MTPTEALELSSTVQLYDELQKRFDHLIFVGIQHRPTHENPRNENRMRRYKGDAHICTGLAAGIAHRLQVEVSAQETTLPPEEL